MSHPVPPTLPASVPFQGPLHVTPHCGAHRGRGPEGVPSYVQTNAAVGPYPEVRSADRGGEGLDWDGAAWIERPLSV